MTTPRDEYNSLRPKNRQTVAGLLARRGRNFDERLRASIEGRRIALPGRPLLPVLCANALIWTHHGKDDAEFMDHASQYFTDGDQGAAEDAADFHHRFGRESLETVLHAMRQLCEQIGRPEFPENLIALQQLQVQLIEDVAREKAAGRFRGLGPWLFPSPFKIFLTWNRRLWDDPDVDRVQLSLGTQVCRALRWLERDGIISRGDYIDDDADDADTSGSKFLTQMGTVQMRHAQICDLAKLAGTKALHINSALYELGYQGH